MMVSQLIRFVTYFDASEVEVEATVTAKSDYDRQTGFTYYTNIEIDWPISYGGQPFREAELAELIGVQPAATIKASISSLIDPEAF